MQSKFDRACELIDAANREDPTTVVVAGSTYPREYLYSKWLVEWVQALRPDASESLLLAARCQHIRRLRIQRDAYPMNRAGYLKWRADLKKFHADEAGQLLEQAGYDSPTLERVRTLNLKKDLKTDPECQTLEDALCLVFLEYQFADFLEKNNDEAKMLNILQKSWNKMSPAGHAAASRIQFNPRQQALLAKLNS